MQYVKILALTLFFLLIFQSIKVDKVNKRALIRFAATESASAFVKRYQRKMIDLSLIKVSLVND